MPKVVTTRYLGIATAVATNIRAVWLMENNAFLERKFFFDKAYPVASVIRMVRNIVSTVMMIELKKYLVIGTPVPDAVLNSLAKFSKVGFDTKNRGGNRNSSESGLKAWETTYKTGSNMKTPMGSRMK